MTEKMPQNAEEVKAFIREWDLLPVVSLSGGKDSLAVALYMRELGIECRHVYADTGWEAPETYEYLDYLGQFFDIDRVKSERGGLADIAMQKVSAPMRRGRWCTEKLKIIPIGAYFRRLEEENPDAAVLSIVGIRAEEGEERAKMAYFEDGGGGVLDSFIWRPIMDWKVEEVLAIHHRHGIDVNPLYKRGHNRVGCYPCVLANKEEVRLVAENHPERIEQIARMEEAWHLERVRRNEEQPGRYENVHPTFFQRSKNIREMVAWSRTKRGGKELPLLPTVPSGGCFRWGLCEPPTKSDE